MANSYVQVQPDSTGKKLQTHQNVVGANTVEAEAVVPVHTDGTPLTLATGVQMDVVSALPAGANAIGKLAANTGVDIGDVDVTSVVPGSAASNLGKAEDAAHTSGDVGVMSLGIRMDTATSLAGAEGDYAPLQVDEVGRLHSRPENMVRIDELNDHTAWAALNNDTLNLATNTQYHVTSTASVEFDKVDGAANTVFGVIDQTIASVDLSAFHVNEALHVATYVSSVAAIDYLLIRLGTDNANYNEWRVDGDELAAGDWNIVKIALGSASISGATGTGMDPSAVTYVAVGYAFDVQNDTLANIRFNHLTVHSSQHTNADIAAEVTSEVSSPNVNVKKWGAVNVTTDRGNSDTGTLRVAVATDDINLAATKTALEIIDDVVQTEDGAHSTGEKGVMLLGVRNDTPTSLVNVDLDYTPIAMDEYGRVRVIIDNPKDPISSTAWGHVAINHAGNGNNTLLAAQGASNKIAVWSVMVVSDGTVDVRFEDGAGGAAFTGQIPLQAREGFTYNSGGLVPLWVGTANTLLNLELSAAINVHGHLSYTVVT